MNDITTDLTHGSSKQTTKAKPFSDPLRHVDRSRDHRTKSVSELVKSATEVCEAIDASRNEPTMLAQVLGKLVGIKMIPESEAAKADIAKMSTISKYRKIDQHRETLLHADVANKICSGPTILYELGLLIDNLPEQDDPAEQLGKYLEKLDGPLTRKWVQDLRESIAPKKRRKKDVGDGNQDSAKQPSQHPDGDKPASEVHADRGDHSAELNGSGEQSRSTPDQGSRTNSCKIDPESAVAEESITAALLICDVGDEEALVLASQQSAWERAAAQIAEDAAIFLFARMDVLLNVSPVIKTFGEFRCSNVFLLSAPDNDNATVCNVLAMFERGEGVSDAGTPAWEADCDSFRIAESFLHGVPGRRLQLFGDAASPDWEMLTPGQ